MREIITIVFVVSFTLMCFLLLFLKNSKNLEDAANLPLDDDEIDNDVAQNKRNEK